MPPRSRKGSDAPSKRAPQEGSTSIALVIALVLSILASLVLGVFLYLAQDKIDKAEKDKTAADSAAAAAKKQTEFTTTYFLTKIRAWVDPTGVDAQDLKTTMDLKNSPEGEAIPQWWKNQEKTVEGNHLSQNALEKMGMIGPLDVNKGALARSFKSVIDELQKSLATEIKNRKDREDQLVKKEAEYKAYMDQHNAKDTASRVQKAQESIENDFKKKIEEKDRIIQSYDGKFAELTKKHEQLLAEVKNASNAEKEALLQKVAKEREDLAEVAKELKKKAEDREKLNLDEPKGRIVRVEPSGDMAMISVGSAQGVQPGLVFAGYGVGPGNKPIPDPKFTLEVVSVVGTNMSLARVTRVAKPADSRGGLDPITNKPIDPSSEEYWIRDPRLFHRNRNPVIAGDLLMNPAWNPGRRVRVALAGTFDIDGDGRDDVLTLKRMLEENGAIIDAYPDPNAEGQTRGKLDYQTEYLIVGGMAVLESGGGKKAVDDRAAVAPRGRGGDEGLKLQEEAIKRGIEIVSLRRFLARMGYSSVRVPTLGVDAQGKGVVGTNPANKPAPPVKEGDAKEGEPKKDNP